MQTSLSRKIGRFSLSVQVSLLLMLAALLPLLITIISSEFLSRPQLIAKANASMEADAQARIQSIENYFSQPIIDVSSLSQSASLSEYLNGDTNVATAATNILATGYQRNVNYISWSLIDLQGKQRLFYPVPALPHGNYFIPPDTVKQLNTPNAALVSSAFYNPEGDKLTVDITEPVTATQTSAIRIIGFLRATLNINFIWNMVLDEHGKNGEGSYAFIIDENGVIIAHTDITQNFTTIAPFTPSEQNDIDTLERYGKNAKIPVLAYGALANVLKSTDPQMTFQMVPPGQKDSFQVIGKSVPIVPWIYFVLSPTTVVTALADQQLFNISIVGLLVLLLAAITGLIVGRRITVPVLSSVAELQASSQLLKDLAAKEQITITEQIWVVDSSRNGLSSVNYYVDATQEAAHYLIETSTGLAHDWPYVNPKKTKDALHQMVMAAHYIKNAVQYQKASSKKLSAAIDLTKQVTDQLILSSEAATQAAEQMEQVVSQLQQVVGKN